VPAHDGDGTNGLLVSPPTALAFAFGPGSCRRHQALAREQGIAAVALTLPGLAADIDKPADLAKLQSMPRRGETGRFLDSIALGATSLGEAASPST
jgi:2-phospho-L-lactate guanylyltransferase